MKKTQLTQNGYDAIQNELTNLQAVKRPIAVDRLQKARAMGDLKENGAYYAAKEELRELDGRILEAQYILGNAEIVTTSPSDSTITLGKTVTVNLNGVKKTLSIVGEFESDPMNGKFSSNSPIGTALLGKKVGDKIEVITPGGTVPYTILSIK
jgi:transcription elongation factor GreA